MQNQSFRVQVWASHENNALAASLAQDLRDRVRQAVVSSRAAIEAGQTFTARTDGQGEYSFHFAIQKAGVKPVDDGETLVVEMDGHDLFAGVQLENFQWFERRVEWGKGGAITSVGFDVQFPSGAHETKTYVVGRNGVTAIRIERGGRRG